MYARVRHDAIKLPLRNNLGFSVQVSGASNPLVEELRIQEFRYYWYSVDLIHRYKNYSIPESLNS